jgi:cyclopropane fatty-acyl-phospholipid synthase-like methyltransferase
MDRIVAFESAHHFSPFVDFVTEARRVLKVSGLLVIAIPVVINKSSGKGISIRELKELGILKITWASEHYEIDHIKSIIENNGFKIDEMVLIGSNVYQPLANYYLKNRNHLRKIILRQYPKYLEMVIHRSMSKMKSASEKGIIEYALIRTIKR